MGTYIRGIALVLIGLVAGYLVGREVACRSGGVPGDPDAALDELLDYRGKDAKAVRRSLALVDDVVEGGAAMLPRLRAAMEGGVNWKYGLGRYQADLQAGVISHYPDLRTALIEAVSRIGGEEAVEILMGVARAEGDWSHRVTALTFLARRGDRADVRSLFTSLLHKYLVVGRNDVEMTMTLRITRGHLDDSAYRELTAAVVGGQFRRSVADEMAETMAAMDRSGAGEVFFAQVRNRTQPIVARASSAYALGRMPELRAPAAALLSEESDMRVVRAYLEGLRYGRFGGIELQRAARDSRDPAKMREFLELKIADLEGGLQALEELHQTIDPAAAKPLEFPRRIQEYREAVAETKKDLEDPAAALLK